MPPACRAGRMRPGEEAPPAAGRRGEPWRQSVQDAAGRKGPSGGRAQKRTGSGLARALGRDRRGAARPRRRPGLSRRRRTWSRAGKASERHGAARSWRWIAPTRPIGMLRRPEPAPKTRRSQTGPHRHVPRRGKAPCKGRIGQRPRARAAAASAAAARACHKNTGPPPSVPPFAGPPCRTRLPPGRSHSPPLPPRPFAARPPCAGPRPPPAGRPAGVKAVNMPRRRGWP